MRGRKPLPASLHDLHGNPGKRARRPIDQAAMMPGDHQATERDIAALKIPPPPRHLSKHARDEWRRKAPDLVRLGLLRVLDGTAFEARCELYSTWRSCREVIAKHGMTYEGNGIIRQRPEVRLAQDCLRQMRQFDSEFGLTPAARARVRHVVGDGTTQQQLPLPEQREPQETETAATPELSKIDDASFFRGPPN